jgi:hypothetical protein
MYRLAQAMSKRIDADLINAYFDDCKGYSITIVEQALGHVRQTARFWPRPVVILDACVEQAREGRHYAGAMPVDGVDAHGIPIRAYACSVCEDTGFERGLLCNGHGLCRLKGCKDVGAEHEPHQFTRRCACRATNPVLMRERDASRRPAPGGSA